MMILRTKAMIGQLTTLIIVHHDPPYQQRDSHTTIVVERSVDDVRRYALLPY